MFGLFRKLRKRKLKQTLLKEGQLDAYIKKFNSRIQTMEQKRQKYIDMAYLGKQSNDEGQMKLGIKYTQYVEGILSKMRGLKARLEAASIAVDSQAAYNDMVLAVSDFTGELKDGSMRKGKQRRILRRFKRETGTLASQIRMIDARLDKIDNNMEKIFEDNQDFSDVNVDDFFSKYSK
jgi:transcriptional antiterminator Rof (Rho-off)